MSELQQVLAEYRPLGIVSGGLILLPPTDALALVDELERLRVMTFAVAGWLGQDMGLMALPYRSIGYGYAEDVAACAASARGLIREQTQQGADYVALYFDYRELGEPFDRRFLPSLAQIAEEIRAEFPDVEVSVASWSAGGQTPYQGWSLGISCLLSDVPDDQSDLVDLCLHFMHMPTDAKIASADVVWGHPSGHIEAELPVNSMPVSEGSLQEIEVGLPTLAEALRNALRRGKPSRTAG